MKNLQKKLKGQKGFTLIELIIVIAIIAILAAVLIPRFGSFTDKAKQTQITLEAKNIATFMDVEYTEDGAWPANAATILAGAGVTSGAGTTLTLPATADGGFNWENVIKGYTGDAGRTDGNTSVEAGVGP